MNSATFHSECVSRSQKKLPETDAIFEQIAAVNKRADLSEHELRISVDCKAAVKVGELSRNGLSRVSVDALDHDFQPDTLIVPIGILMPRSGELSIYMVRSPATADAIADAIESWWFTNCEEFPNVGRLVIDLDNGPENHSRRTQFMSRMVQLSDEALIAVELAYYPPYHSKYNPIERCWASLEKYWNGALLDSIEAVVGYAANMTWHGLHPFVQFVDRVYEKSVKLCKAHMAKIEQRICRHSTLRRWFVDIPIVVN